MADNNQETQEANQWMALGKSNKEDFATRSLAWTTEANQSDRHLSGQLTSSASLFITVGSGFFALANNSLSLDERIFIFLSLILFAVSLGAGIIYSFQLRKFFEKACLATSESEGVWAYIVRSKDEYEDKNRQSCAILERLPVTSPQLGLYGQALFLGLGLLSSFVGVFLYLFVGLTPTTDPCNLQASPTPRQFSCQTRRYVSPVLPR